MQSLRLSGLVQTVWAIDEKGQRGKPVRVGWAVVESKLLSCAGPRSYAPVGFGRGQLNGRVSPAPEPANALLLAMGPLFIARRRLRT